MATRNLTYGVPVSLAIAEGATTPDPGGAAAKGAVVWSTTTATMLKWNGAAWYSVAPTRAVGITIDGVTAVPAIGLKGLIVCPFAGTLISWAMVADAAGSMVIDVWKQASGTIPVKANSITASAKPTLSSQQMATSSTLTGWTTAVAAGDVFGFEVESVSVIKRATLSLGLRV